MEDFDNVAAFDAERFRTDTEFLEDFNRHIIAEFRSNRGKVGGVFAGMDVVLLTTTGAKSGLPRLKALVSLAIEGRMFVVGSRGGASRDPAWVFNLRANPKARLEIGEESYDVNVREPVGPERDELFAKVVAVAPNFGEYQAKTTRVIPLFEFLRASEVGADA